MGKCIMTALHFKLKLHVTGKLFAMEYGMRFLTDSPEGDSYFTMMRTEHNLDRCRTPIAPVESIEAQMNAMMKLIEKF